MKNIKIFGNEEISFALSDNQTKEIKHLSGKVDSEILTMFWQFSVKSLEELNIVSNQNLSIEMFLIRLIHLKKIPKLEELLENLEISEDKIIANETKDLPSIKNEIKEDIIKKPNESKDQIKNIFQEKKVVLENRNISKLSNKNEHPKETISSFNSLIRLCSKHKELQLKYNLEKNVRLVKFLDGQIEFSFNENFDRDFIKNLSRKLIDWTKKRWIITLSKEKGQQTHQEVKIENKRTQLEETTKTSAYKKMLEVFPDAKLISIEKNEGKK